jgi:hypothetical protein
MSNADQIEQAAAHTGHVLAGNPEWPKWVPLHESYLTPKKSAGKWRVMVLVANEDEEKLAGQETPAPPSDEKIRRQDHLAYIERSHRLWEKYLALGEAQAALAAHNKTIATLREALQIAINRADAELHNFDGRTPACQADYDRCVAALASTEGTGQQK